MEKRVHIEEPCKADWGKMTRVEAGRHCKLCEKTVVDFTQKTNQEIVAYITQSDSGVCGRFYSEQVITPEIPAARTWWKYPAWAATFLALIGFSQEKAQAQKVGKVMVNGGARVSDVYDTQNEITLTVLVIDVNKKILADAYVSIMSEGKEIAAGTTNSMGRLVVKQRFTNPNPQVSISVSYGSYYRFLENVPVVKSAQTVRVEFGENDQIMIMGEIAPYIPDTIVPEPIDSTEESHLITGDTTLCVVPEAYTEPVDITDTTDRNPGDGIEVLAFPNPSNGIFELVIEASGTELQNGLFEIRRITGEFVMMGSLQSRMRIDLSAHSSGTYIWSWMVNGNAVETRKLILNKEE